MLRPLAFLALLAGIGAAAAQDKLPLIKVVATGGTIANTPSGRLHAGEVARSDSAAKESRAARRGRSDARRLERHHGGAVADARAAHQ